MASTGLIILASEQLWPNIYSIVHELESLQVLCVYCTDDDSRSIKPAQRLEQLCQESFPKLQVDLKIPPPGIKGIYPQEVRQQIHDWQAAYSVERWLLNATGGLKLMFAGVLEFVGAPKTTVIYRELSGDWFEFVREKETILCRTYPFQVGTDQLPVAALIKAQWNDAHKANVEYGPPPSLTPEQLQELVEQGVQSGWDWKKMFCTIGLKNESQSKSAGLLFEDFTAATVQALGVTNLQMNIVLRSQEGQALQEIDIVVNHGGRLLLMDCKLRTQEEEKSGRVEGLTSQIRQAALTQRSLGGLAAKMLLVRPNRPFTADEKELAKAHRLTVLDQGDAIKFFSQIALFLGLRAEDMPVPLKNAEAILQQQENNLLGIFGSAPSTLAKAFPVGRSQAFLDMDSLVQQLTQELPEGQDWLVYRYHGAFYFRCQMIGKEQAESLFQTAKATLEAWGKVENQGVNSKGTIATFCLRLCPGIKSRPIVDFLEERTGCSLFPDKKGAK